MCATFRVASGCNSRPSDASTGLGWHSQYMWLRDRLGWAQNTCLCHSSGTRYYTKFRTSVLCKGLTTLRAYKGLENFGSMLYMASKGLETLQNCILNNSSLGKRDITSTIVWISILGGTMSSLSDISQISVGSTIYKCVGYDWLFVRNSESPSNCRSQWCKRSHERLAAIPQVTLSSSQSRFSSKLST